MNESTCWPPDYEYPNPAQRSWLWTIGRGSNKVLETTPNGSLKQNPTIYAGSQLGLSALIVVRPDAGHCMVYRLANQPQSQTVSRLRLLRLGAYLTLVPSSRVRRLAQFPILPVLNFGHANTSLLLTPLTPCTAYISPQSLSFLFPLSWIVVCGHGKPYDSRSATQPPSTKNSQASSRLKTRDTIIILIHMRSIRRHIRTSILRIYLRVL